MPLSSKPVPLSMLPVGRLARIVQLPAEAVAPVAAARLQAAGFLPHESVEVLHRGWGGPTRANVLVRVGGHSNFALRSAEAAGILVLPHTVGVSVKESS